MLVRLPDGQWVENSEIRRIGKLKAFPNPDGSINYESIIDMASTGDLKFFFQCDSLEGAQKKLDEMADKANELYEMCLPPV